MSSSGGIGHLTSRLGMTPHEARVCCLAVVDQHPQRGFIELQEWDFPANFPSKAIEMTRLR
jgi:hypothetical protein